jgi:outer membrane protein OmpA-like peptidoglycan-associated protein
MRTVTLLALVVLAPGPGWAGRRPADQCQRCRAGQRRCVGVHAYMTCKVKPGKREAGRCNVWSAARRCPAGQRCKAGRCVGRTPPPPPPAPPAPPAPTAKTYCKGKKTDAIVVKGGRIYLCQKIAFKPTTATILPRSYPILAKLARLLTTTHTGGRVRIEGHTNSRGSSAYNLRISQAKADAVRAHLIGKGVAAGRLLAKGWGEERPVDTDYTRGDWVEVNKRIEFHLVK